MVTYRYYVGRLNTFEDHYEDAETNLDFALIHCHKNAIQNKRRILNYLLPVKLLRGRLPTRLRMFPMLLFVICFSFLFLFSILFFDEWIPHSTFVFPSFSSCCFFLLIYFYFFPVLEKYSLNEFLPIVEGIRKGDLRSFTDGLTAYQDVFIR